MQLTEYKSDLPLQWARFAGKGLSALMLAAGLCAVHLWPMLELLPLSTRGGMNLSESIRYSLPPPLLIGLVLPTALAFPEWVIYLGLGTLNLAPASLLAFDQDREEMFVFALVVIGIAFSLGRATPLYALLFRFLPGMSWFRVPTRMMFLVQLGLALLTGVGWDTLRDLRPQRRRMLTSYSSALALAVSLGAVCSNIYLDVLDIPLLSSAIASAILIVLIGRSRIPRLRVRAYLLLGALMIMESKALALHFIAPAQSSSLSAATREIEFIGSRPGKFRTYSTHGTISLAEAVVYGVERADGKDPFQLKHYVKWLNTSSGCHLETYAISVPACAGNEVAREAYLRAQPNEVLLGIGNVQYVIADHSLESWEPSIWRFGDTRIYENPEVMPRGFVVPEVVVNDDNAAALALLEEMGPRTLATVPWMRDKPMYSDSSYSRARVIERSPNHAELQANGPGWLVWSEVWAPGWQASVDGHKTKVHRTNVAFCGLSLPEGPHVVRFDYKPSGWIWARRISLGAIIAVIVMIVASMQNRLHRGFRESVEKPTSRSIHR